MIKFFINLIFFCFLCTSSANALNDYSYDKTGKFNKKFCKNLYNKLDSTDVPNNRYYLTVDLLIENIAKIDPINNEFEAYFSLWVHWKDKSVISLLKSLNAFYPEEAYYLCTYDPQKVWYEDFALFEPVVEFYGNKPRSLDPDWVEIFSDGTVQLRLRGYETFKSYFDFKNFPFDTQTFYFYLYSEYPKSVTIFRPDRAMEIYKKDLYSDSNDDYNLNIPGWEVKKVDYYEESYFDNIDGHSYSGFIVEIEAERIFFWYIFKIMAPIFFILLVSWSVFWLGAKQVESKVTITIVALLGLIAYNFIISNEVPKLSYLTFMDVFILLAYLFSGFATIIAVASNAYYRNTNINVNFIDRYARYLGIGFYFLLNIINYYYFIYL